MRLRKKPWVKEEIIQYTSHIVLNPEQQKNNWNAIFKNDNPIHIEIGTGRGKFITTLAKNNPEINYIALEQKEEVLVQGIRKANEMKLRNMKFILDNANSLLDFFGEKEISRIYLNFVDPWPKKRHQKRRLTHIKYLEMYKHVLRKDGEIHLKTDNEILFEFSINQLSEQNFKLSNVSLNLYRNEENIKLHTQTEYEDLFIAKGKSIFRLEAIVH